MMNQGGDDTDTIPMESYDFSGNETSSFPRVRNTSMNSDYIGANLGNSRGTRVINDDEHDENYSFEKQRKMAESKIVSEWPHAQREDVPLLGPDEFPQWFSPIPVFLWYFLSQFAACLMYSFIVTAISMKYPPTSFTNVNGLWIRSSVIGIGAGLVQLLFGETTGAYLDVYLLWLVVVCNMFFSRRYGSGKAGIWARMWVIGKGVIFTGASIGGYFAGVALAAVKMGGSVTTSSCKDDPQPICLAHPSVNFVNDEQATYMVFFGHLFIQISVFLAWSLLKKRTLWVQLVTKSHVHETLENDDNDNKDSSDDQKEKRKAPKYVAWKINDSWIAISIVVAAAHAAVNLSDSSNVGSGPDTLYWLVTSVYTNDFSGRAVQAWPGLLAGIFVFLGRGLYQLLVSTTVYYRSKVLSSTSYHVV